MHNETRPHMNVVTLRQLNTDRNTLITAVDQLRRTLKAYCDERTIHASLFSDKKEFEHLSLAELVRCSDMIIRSQEQGTVVEKSKREPL
jgi:hypothetical protein